VCALEDLVLSYLKRRMAAVRESLRYEGVPVLLYRTLKKAASPFVDVDHQILFEGDLTHPIEQRKARIDCVIEQATEQDLEEIAWSRFPDLMPVGDRELSDEEEYDRARYLRERATMGRAFLESIREWMRSGELCFVARVNGRIAHSNWLQLCGTGTPDQKPIHLLPNEVYTTEGFTVEEYRGLGLHEAVLSRMLRYAQERGCTHAYTITDLVKTRARRGLARVGMWSRRGHHLFVSSKRFDRTWIVPLGGNVDPIMRALFDESHAE
jgi:GNAT superfamily N-acetyltransferase